MKTVMKLVQVNADIGGKTSGERFTLSFTDGVPVDSFWRRRFNDDDDCISVVTESKKKEIK